MIKKLNEIWQKKGFEIILCLCISFIFIFGIYHFLTKKKGTFSQSNYYPILPAKSYKSISPVKSYQNTPKESKGEAECRRVLCRLKRVAYFTNFPVHRLYFHEWL